MSDDENEDTPKYEAPKKVDLKDLVNQVCQGILEHWGRGLFFKNHRIQLNYEFFFTKNNKFNFN